ncbi:DEAD/DEAH box helicase [Arthrobacter sunyaminii]|uniref:DEAD/DEAH box helicase family protein n=1 Tax=Arthrobacter sunyaminii TaxID=2816859 RepID=A0A975XLA4_9MICC|nr:DEAD/DEAH box helicase family protein [Arthrobacter sunyaminii]MBO0907789.1 DEAD/DEAH box helicase family protein [Arthrobacter sunyaminii]QWQ36849.1 DEAD/DEAH box helicase family protein [Arthrobacter sunyaminii]
MYELREYQSKAVSEVLTCIAAAHVDYEQNLAQTAIALVAPTGAGKTVMAGAVIDTLLTGEDREHIILWVTDNPSLNRQSANSIRASTSGQFPITVLSGNGEDPETGKPFDQNSFDQGVLYMINTQAASSSAGLSVTQRGGRRTGRTFTIQETIANTINKYGSRFIIMIDEAHRGVERVETTETVIGSFIRDAPVVLGISATERRFTEWMARIDRHLKRVVVPLTDVRAAGIIKSNLIVSDTVDGKHAHMTLLRNAVRQTLTFDESWERYCSSQGLRRIYPLLVVQVEDSGSDPETQTLFQFELEQMIRTVMEEWPELSDQAFVHTFAERKPLVIEGLRGGSRVVQYMLPDHIDRNDTVRVVFAKTAISTGWDCPRAEVLVSFRSAKDESYITQLIGRMIRQPLGVRVEDDESLNSTYCTLPNFDQQAVRRITKRLIDEDGIALDVVNAVPITYRRSDLPDAVFEALKLVPSYVVPTGATASKVSLLRRFAFALERDALDKSAPDHVKDEIIRQLDAIRELRARQFIRAMNWVRQLEGQQGSITILQTTIPMDDDSEAVDLSEDVVQIDDADATSNLLADSAISSDVHSLYHSHLQRSASIPVGDANRILKAFDYPQLDTVGVLEDVAERLLFAWKQAYEDELEARVYEVDEKYNVYREVTGRVNDPILNYASVVPTVIQENIGADLMEAGQKFLGDGDPVLIRRWVLDQKDYWHHRHLYTADEKPGQYLTRLSSVRQMILRGELGRAGITGWYNNPKRGARAITVPWTTPQGEWGEMHPDFVFLSEDDGEVAIGLADAVTGSADEILQKLRWWLWYADRHYPELGFVRLVIQGRDSGNEVLHIDLMDDDVREVLRRELARDNSAIEALFRAHGGIYTL